MTYSVKINNWAVAEEYDTASGAYACKRELIALSKSDPADLGLPVLSGSDVVIEVKP